MGNLSDATIAEIRDLLRELKPDIEEQSVSRILANIFLVQAARGLRDASQALGDESMRFVFEDSFVQAATTRLLAEAAAKLLEAMRFLEGRATPWERR